MIVDPVITRGRCLASGSGRHSVEKIMLNYGANQPKIISRSPTLCWKPTKTLFPQSSLQEQIDESTQLVNPHAVLAHARVSKKNVAGAQLYHGQQLVAVKRRRQAARDLVVRAGHGRTMLVSGASVVDDRSNENAVGMRILEDLSSARVHGYRAVALPSCPCGAGVQRRQLYLAGGLRMGLRQQKQA
ncbi:hypothetical protein M0657_009279 [Pyricularia oryzae]|nr:hypothetical protein M0657_009279 [Pyricularia oryzae]